MSYSVELCTRKWQMGITFNYADLFILKTNKKTLKKKCCILLCRWLGLCQAFLYVWYNCFYYRRSLEECIYKIKSVAAPYTFIAWQSCNFFPFFHAFIHNSLPLFFPNIKFLRSGSGCLLAMNPLLHEHTILWHVLAHVICYLVALMANPHLVIYGGWFLKVLHYLLMVSHLIPLLVIVLTPLEN